MLIVARYIICEIDDKTFDSHYSTQDINSYHVRKASRGILINGGKIALLNVTTKNYHKLPGGGIEKGETNDEAFRREALEETGCNCTIKESSPVTIEYRDRQKLVQISYVYLAEVKGEISTPKFEEDEKKEGFKLVWVPIEEAEHVLSQDKPTDWEGDFILLRDKEIFKFYKKQLFKEIR